jgi:hypothetical protein
MAYMGDFPETLRYLPHCAGLHNFFCVRNRAAPWEAANIIGINSKISVNLGLKT